MTDTKKHISDLYEALQKVSNAVCEARNLAEELESDTSDPREWTVEEWRLDDFQMRLTEWRETLETVEGEIDDMIPKKPEN